MNLPLIRRVGTSLAVALLATATLVVSAHGQVTRSDFVDVERLAAAEARYRTAVANHDGLREGVAEVEVTWRRAAQQIQARDADGDDRGRAEVFRDQFIDSALRLSELEVVLQGAREELRTARRDYLRVLDDERERLVRRVEEGDVPEGREEEFSRAVVALVVEHSRVERERDPLEEFVLRPLPRMEADPRDGPAELLLKASYMEDEVATTYNAVIESLDEEIARREQRLRQERALSDQQADLSRFDSDLLVGGAGVSGVRGEELAEEVLEGLPLFADRPLPEQVALLRSIRDQAADRRDEALDEADRFRRLAAGDGP